MGFRFLIAALLVLSQFSFSHASDQETSIDLSEMARRFVVKIVSETATVFSADRSGGHGTGFIVDIRQGPRGPMAVVFTNKHVIDSLPLEVQRLTVEIATEDDVHQKVPARLSNQAPIEDFAIVEFDLVDAGPAAKDLLPIPVPEEDSPAYRFTENHRLFQGREVVAIGNPFSSSDIITFGQINGRHVNEIGQTYIQTQTPINPGNSGGPLFSLEDGVVIGMNTAGIDGASNVGYAIPIGDLLEEYKIWQRSPHMMSPRQVLIQIEPVSEDLLKIDGAYELIKHRIPGFFKKHTGLTMIRTAAASSGLESGDYLISINGQTFGDHYYKFLKAVQYSENLAADVGILRNGQFLNMQIPIVHLGLAHLRESHDFVMISGAIFTEITPFEAFLTNPEAQRPTQVELTQHLETAEFNFGAFRLPSAGSLITGVTINNTYYSVRKLVDLKVALQRHPKATSLKLQVRETMPYKLRSGDIDIVKQASGAAIHHPLPSTYIVPITEVITPRHLSLRDFRKDYSFEAQQFKTRDWRKAIQAQAKVRRERRKALNAAGCESSLVGIAEVARVD